MLQAPSFSQQYGNSLQGYPAQPQNAPSYYGAAGAYGGTTGGNGTTPPTSNADQAFVSRGDGVRSSAGLEAGGNVVQQTTGQPFNFTSAPYSHAVPAQAPSALAPHFAQQQQRQSASPQPNAAAQQNTRLSPPNKYPMAAPPLPQTPTAQQQGAAANSTASPKSPQTPGSINREQQRINLLFEINVELLQEVNRLQGEGQGGAISPQQLALLRKEGKGDKMASEEYIQCLRRVQANLAYLMPMAQGDTNSQSKIPPGPAHMTPPAHMEQLQNKYEQLRELFPGWSGMDHRPSQSSASPRPNGMAGSPAPA